MRAVIDFVLKLSGVILVQQLIRISGGAFLVARWW